MRITDASYACQQSIESMFQILDILIDMQLYLVPFLVNYLVISDADHLPICLSSLCVCSVLRCLFRVFLHSVQFSSVQFSCSVMSDSLLPHGLPHAKPPCPSPAPRVYPSSCPSSRWCYPTVSSSVVPFSSLHY